MTLEDELDRLYRAPLGEFIALRNDLARRLRAAGDREAAERIKKLAKPSLTAWAVNQIHFRARPELDALMAAGEGVRRAHLSDAEAHRAAAKVKREAVSRLLTSAAGILKEQGTSLGRSHRQRISQTLEALAGGAGDATPGRLSRDLEPPGFDALSGLAAALEGKSAGRSAPPEPATFRSRPVAVVPRDADAEPAEVVDLGAERRARARQREREIERRRARDEQQLAQAQETVEDAQARVAELEAQAAGAESSLQTAEIDARQAANAADEAERRAQEARDRARAAAQAARQARLEAESVKASLERSRARLEEARRAFERLRRDTVNSEP